jgi:hypothetical protein
MYGINHNTNKELTVPRRISWAAGAAGGGLLATALLSTAVAVAVTPTDNAFTIGDFTFDPGTDGFAEIPPLSQVAPLLEIGGANLNDSLTGVGLAQQDLEVYSSDGTDLGSVTTNVNAQDLFGFVDSAQLIVSDVAPAADGTVGDLPAVGTVYSVTDLGGGIENVYTAVPGSDGGAATITDTLVTPFGNVDLSSLFATYDATQLLDPGDPFASLGVDGGAGDLSDNAFAVGGFTFDPGADGFAGANPLFGIAPLLRFGGGTASLGGFTLPLDSEDLTVYGSDGTDLGTVTTNVNTSDIAGFIDTTQLSVSASTPAEGVDAVRQLRPVDHVRRHRPA